MSSGSGLARLQIAAGAVLILGALCLDLVGIGSPGFGTRQILIAVVGALLIVTAGPPRRWIAQRWATTPAIRATDCVLWAVWVGLATGFFEVVHLVARNQLTGFIIRQSDMIVASAPLTYLILCGALGLIAAILTPACPRVIRAPLVIFALVWLAIWNQLSHYGRIDALAILALSAGVAWQIARTASRRWGGFAVLRRRTLPWLIGMFVVAAAGVQGTRAISEASTLGSLPEARKGAPNIVLIVLDTVRADHLGCYGYSRDTTPNIDGLANAGVVFERLVSTSPWTLPSHATLFTGHYNDEHGADWVVPLDDRLPTLAEVLSENGYATAGFVGNLGYCSRTWGIARGFAHYEDYDFSLSTLASFNPLGRLLMPRATHIDLVRGDAETISSRLLAWLPAAEDRPFFAFLNYYDAHELYRAPGGFAGHFGKERLDPDRWEDKEHTEQDIQEMRNAYDSCLLYLDHHIGRIVDHLDETGELDNTLFIVTGDHGEHFGENGLFSHGNSLYWQLLHVPLIVHYPAGRLPTQRSGEFVTLRDLPATILDLAGVTDAPIPGVSLRPLWEGGAAQFQGSRILADVQRGIRTPPWEPITKGNMSCEIVDGIHTITNGDGTKERYDVRADPREENDLNK